MSTFKKSRAVLTFFALARLFTWNRTYPLPARISAREESARNACLKVTARDAPRVTEINDIVRTIMFWAVQFF
jgi:hypothetical protein